MNYYGKIYVDTDTHFAQGFKDGKSVNSDQPYYYYSTQNKTVMFKFLDDSCPITSAIAAGKCHHGYNPPTPPSDYDVRIMAEDLNATAADGDIENSDWDFNDVVFDVKYNAAGTGATIKLVAAGGVLKLTVAGHEVHEAFGEQFDAAKGEYPMINTGKGPNHDPVTFEIRSGLTRSENGKDISIVVYKKLSENSELVPFELTGEKGKPAAKFAVQPGTPYCNERVHIDAASNGAFSRGVQNGGEIYWGGPVE